MVAKLKIFPTAEETAAALAQDFFNASQRVAPRESFTVAFSGGRTPIPFFQHLAAEYGQRVHWQRVHVFWVDERCVPPEHPDSNYGMTRSVLLDLISLPPTHIHRIRGEIEATLEVARYHQEIDQTVKKAENGLPSFDWLLLGMGEDGHIASLFPGSGALNQSPSFCLATRHPQTGQPRITLTLAVINSARRIKFLVCGADKAKMTAAIINREAAASSLPASSVQPLSGTLEWYLDAAAAQFLG